MRATIKNGRYRRPKRFITDTQRLNWILEHSKGHHVGKEPWNLTYSFPALDGWDGKNTLKHRRKEIDAAMRSSAERGKAK